LKKGELAWYSGKKGNVKSIGHFVQMHFWIILGLFLFILGIMECINNIRAIQGKTVTTQAKIVSCKIDEGVSSGGGTVSMSYAYCTPTVRFKTNSGQEIDEVVSVYGLDVSEFYEGKIVTVSYAPNHPQQALITSRELWSSSIADGGLGLICFMIDGILNLWRLKKKKTVFLIKHARIVWHKNIQ
jgi:hypothetical protein